MTFRTKLLSIFIALAVVPALVVGIFNYFRGAQAVESVLLAEAQARTRRIARNVEIVLDAHEKRLVKLSEEESLTTFVRDSRMAGATVAGARPDVPETVKAHFIAFFANSRGHFESISCLDPAKQPLFRVSNSQVPGGPPQFQVRDIVPTSVRADDRVWQVERAELLRLPLTQESYGTSLRTTVPIFAGEAGRRPVGALVLELKLKEVLEEAAETRDPYVAPPGRTERADAGSVIIALDNAGSRIAYHTNGTLKYQPTSAMPEFEAVASKMQAGDEGGASYDSKDGDRMLATFRQVRGLNLSVAVAENYSAAVAGITRSSLLGTALLLLAGAVGVVMLMLIARRTTRRIERVAAGAAAIARGDLNQRIEVDSGDETRNLAESFNRMSDRLRELILRETESKQFESFMRLSAMLTHDLKNAITGLSILVSNMEHHLHREEFREDAVLSLREATDKLKRIVSRLTEPAKSLSGEYRRDARATDLVPIIRRVLAMNAEPSSPLYEIETKLPETLVAVAESDRIENVIENLVINALEAMGAVGGRLTVEAGHEAENLVFFSVADTGAGMNEEFIKLRLFRPFSTTKQKGIGLGLFTCREVVEAHGGRLEVESKLGTGTRFRVVLPSRLFASGERSSRTSGGAFG